MTKVQNTNVSAVTKVENKKVKKQQQKPLSQERFIKQVQAIWSQKSAIAMRQQASAVQKVDLAITLPQSSKPVIH